MDRKAFLKRSALGAAAMLSGTAAHANLNDGRNDDSPKDDALVGFNHLPNREVVSDNTVLHRANTRGHANHGWLDSRHTFSFANYRNPERMHFGVLRVLNDDVVAGGKGFGAHPHDNMEIVSIPLEGDLEHQDSMGNKTVIREGDIQIMSAGTGVRHSEYNKHGDKPVKFLQIWMFPNQRNVTPRYDQIRLSAKPNAITQILSPNVEDEGVWAHQNSWWHIASFEAGKSDSYSLKDASNNGVYAFVLEGSLTIAGESLNARDGFGIWNVDLIELLAEEKTKVLLMEVPMAIG